MSRTRPSEDEIEQTAALRREFFSNPAYAGAGGYPPVITREDWIAANVERMASEDPADVLASIFDAVNDYFTANPSDDDDSSPPT